MIDMNQMMLNNWVNYFYYDFEMRVDIPRQVTNSFFSMSEKGLQDFEPIPLTPEILGKAAFIIKDGYFVFADNEWFSVRLEGVWCSLYCNKIYYAVDFKYLHQLQNLYFCLSGNELKVNI